MSLQCLRCGHEFEPRYNTDPRTFVCRECGPVAKPFTPPKPSDQSWRNHAACGLSTSTFDLAADGDLAAVRRAKSICRDDCPVFADCWAFVMNGLEHGSREHRWGVWAGMTPAERATAHKKQREAGAA